MRKSHCNHVIAPELKLSVPLSAQTAIGTFKSLTKDFV